MDLITAILLFFGMISPSQTQLSPAQFNSMIQENQAVIQYYQANPDQVVYLAGAHIPAIDRAED